MDPSKRDTRHGAKCSHGIRGEVYRRAQLRDAPRRLSTGYAGSAAVADCRMIGRFSVSQSKTIIRGLAQPIHKHFRGGKSERFLGLLNPQPGKLLDVGGGTGMN